MILIEAFAAGTPVVASAIAGYAEVVTTASTGSSCPPGDPQRLAEELQAHYLEPARRASDGRGGPRVRQALRLAPIADRVEGVYERRWRVPPRRK